MTASESRSMTWDSVPGLRDESNGPRWTVPVTLHARQSDDGTDFAVVVRDGDLGVAKDTLCTVSYPVRGVQRDFIVAVAREMDVEIDGSMRVLTPTPPWDDHVAYPGLRKAVTW